MNWEGLVLMSRSTGVSELSQHSHFSVLVFLAVLLFLVNPFLFSNGLSYSQWSISHIDVQLDGKTAPSEITELIPITTGEVLSYHKISRIIKELYDTGLFSDIQVEKDGDEQASLTFILKSQPYVRNIMFRGSDNLPTNKIKKEITVLKEREPFYEGKLIQANKELEEILKQKGKFDPIINSYVRPSDDPSLLDVVFNIQTTNEYIIRNIRIKGDVIVPDSRLRKKMTLQEGNSYIRSTLEKDIEKLKELFSEEGYQRVEIQVNEDFSHPENVVSLVLNIKAHEKIEIEVSGADVPLSLLKPIWEANVFLEWGVDQGKAKIIRYLQKKGYLFANVRGSVVREENTIKILYRVFPGEKYKINDIVFKKIDYFTPEQLKSELAIRENAPLLSNITGDELFELPSEIESLYETRGFPQVRITTNFRKMGNRVDAVFFIEEGVQNKVEKISFQGVKELKPKDLLQSIETSEGGPFYQPMVQRDVENLENHYLNRGYRGTEIYSSSEETGEHSYYVAFEVTEGERVLIKNIVIAGNKITRRNTILREVLLQPGDYARYDEIRATKRRLENLGIFSKVEIEEVSLEPGSRNLLINVREGKRNYVSLGVGLETKNEPRSFQAWDSIIRPRGTVELIRGNIFGTGAHLSAVGQLSLKEKRGVVSWEQPYLFGIPVDTYLNAWLERESRKSYGFDRRGISLSAIKPLVRDENKLFMMTLRFARTSLFELKISESEVDRQFFPFSATSISGSLIWDQRDDSFNPETGYFASAVLEWAYPLFHAESDYLKLFTKYQQFLRIMPKVTFSFTSRLGLGKGRMPIHERFFAGGSNSYRGTPFDELGPKDPVSLQPVGGKALFLMNFELWFPVISYLKDLYGAVFYDKGNLFYKRSLFDLMDLQDTLGFGLRYTTPLGPLRLELAWNFDAPSDKKQPLVIVAIGHVF
ncbi:MAG: BamA/TamA family outer membrane protein [Candidatus Aminicenantes bacterium]|nr:BamA/TamA family outer membrane protein [Candidatus Aminicenantes bacterium]